LEIFPGFTAVLYYLILTLIDIFTWDMRNLCSVSAICTRLKTITAQSQANLNEKE